MSEQPKITHSREISHGRVKLPHPEEGRRTAMEDKKQVTPEGSYKEISYKDLTYRK